MQESKEALVTRLFEEQRGQLYAFLQRRIRNKPEAADLVQETYLRMLRVADVDAIRDPARYLFTIAANLVRERADADFRQSTAVELDHHTVQTKLSDTPAYDQDVDASRDLQRLADVLAELSPKCRATVVMRYKFGMQYSEIGQRLGISANMVKKYLVQAIAHCRRTMVNSE